MSNILTRPLTTIDSVPMEKLGAVVTLPNSDGYMNTYMYVKFVDAVTYAAGHVLTWANAAGTSVTNDRSGGASLSLGPAGVAIAIMTANSYGWMQVGGVATCLGDGSVAAGESVVPDTTDGKADTMAAGEEDLVFGIALEADDASTALFKCRLRGLVS
jgi:hypothetical protein